MNMTEQRFKISSKYNATRFIGKGGTGDVYEGIHIPSQRRVAIKILRSAISSKSMARFLRAAKLTAALQHKHICRILDYGQMADSRPFLVMEYLDGVSFAEYLAQGNIKLAPVLEVMSQMLGALEAAHRQQIIHRDFKPDNIQLLRETDGLPNAKLMDFSSLKNADFAEYTTRDIVLGTPMYMAPEQAMGAECNHRIDIWAAGVVLYEALTGKKPYDSTTPSQIIYDIASGYPILYPREINHRIPAAIEQIIIKAMARIPADRYQTAKEMRCAIEEAKSTCRLESFDDPENEFELGYETNLS